MWIQYCNALCNWALNLTQWILILQLPLKLNKSWSRDVHIGSLSFKTRQLQEVASLSKKRQGFVLTLAFSDSKSISINVFLLLTRWRSWKRKRERENPISLSQKKINYLFDCLQQMQFFKKIIYLFSCNWERNSWKKSSRNKTGFTVKDSIWTFFLFLHT